MSSLLNAIFLLQERGPIHFFFYRRSRSSFSWESRSVPNNLLLESWNHLKGGNIIKTNGFQGVRFPCREQDQFRASLLTNENGSIVQFVMFPYSCNEKRRRK